MAGSLQLEDLKLLETGDYASDSMLRITLTVTGTFLVGLGVLGLFLPLLPTTPFLLLAAACYARSSSRFYNWLLSNRWFGRYIRLYREEKRIPLTAKIISISLLWLTITLSVVFAVDSLLARVVLALIALGVTAHILSVSTARR